jgi:alpha-beta hydrolase superfamily lysophospholipase
VRAAGSREWVASWGTGAYFTGETHLLMVPTQWDRTSDRRLVIRARGGSASTPFTDQNFCDHWCWAGYPVLTCDLGSSGGAGGKYGNDTVVGSLASNGRIEKAWDWAKSNLAIHDDGFILDGGSRGAVDALNYLVRFPSKVVACTLTIPVLEAEDIRANNRANQQAIIEAAYTNNAGWQAARPTRNPVEIADDVAAVGVPLKMWTSENDDICLDQFADAFEQDSGCERASLGAVGHTVNGWDPTQLHDFVEGYA